MKILFFYYMKVYNPIYDKAPIIHDISKGHHYITKSTGIYTRGAFDLSTKDSNCIFLIS